MAKKYRKKEMEAVQVKWEKWDELCAFIGAKDDDHVGSLTHDKKLTMYICTMSGRVRVDEGDYILRFPDGELAACSKEKFEKLYMELD